MYVCQSSQRGCEVKIKVVKNYSDESNEGLFFVFGGWFSLFCFWPLDFFSVFYGPTCVFGLLLGLFLLF